MAIWCTIRTFSAHAKELGNEMPKDVITFVKPLTCLNEDGRVKLSSHPGEMHHEIECVVKLDANLNVESIAVGLDLTDRAAQSELRAEGYPWAKGKCFRDSALVGDFSPWSAGNDSLNSEANGLELELRVNGVVKQKAKLSEMSIPIHHQISKISEWSPIQAGDFLFTGTPAGVGKLNLGDKMHAVLMDGDGITLSEINATCV